MTTYKQPTTRDQVIDRNLQMVFKETIEEGIPDRFKDLLDQLKQQDGQGPKE